MEHVMTLLCEDGGGSFGDIQRVVRHSSQFLAQGSEGSNYNDINDNGSNDNSSLMNPIEEKNREMKKEKECVYEKPVNREEEEAVRGMERRKGSGKKSGWLQEEHLSKYEKTKKKKETEANRKEEKRQKKEEEELNLSDMNFQPGNALGNASCEGLCV
jgi:hypothetical protein